MWGLIKPGKKKKSRDLQIFRLGSTLTYYFLFLQDEKGKNDTSAALHPSKLCGALLLNLQNI